MTSRPHPDRVAVLAPMVSEIRPVVKAFSLARGEIGGLRVATGLLGDVEIVAVKIGVGTSAAATTTERLLDVTTVDHVLVVGIAGGLVPEVEIGDMIFPSRVRDRASGAEYVPAGLAPGEASGTLLTSDEFIADPHEMEKLAGQGVVGLDMETAAVAAVCERRGCAWSVVRSVSDRPGDVQADVFDLAGADGEPSVGTSIRFMATQPHRVPALARLARNAQRAADRAAAAAVTACTRP
jgi:nucleoside phosphorylase